MEAKTKVNTNLKKISMIEDGVRWSEAKHFLGGKRHHLMHIIDGNSVFLFLIKYRCGDKTRQTVK